ncbi:hypothetical protein L2755_09460 [Shewanella abyssi]|uniref:hypothetical protein n=1 Tax=Shewanella abyssi TaxID=311789 RepID=UPI00200E32B0|nr:hypothetical protein [Shewanella abyssi]MCL1049847.1 hypothetical protein [Shewanella abyssi]
MVEAAQEWSKSDLIALGAFALAFVGFGANICMFVWSRRVNTKQGLINAEYAENQNKLNVLLLKEKKAELEDTRCLKTLAKEESLKAKFEVDISVTEDTQFQVILKNTGSHDAMDMGFFFIDHPAEIIRNGVEYLPNHKLTNLGEEAAVAVRYTPDMNRLKFTVTWSDGRAGTQSNTYSTDVSACKPKVILNR